jgi:hypothetical protein
MVLPEPNCSCGSWLLNIFIKKTYGDFDFANYFYNLRGYSY